LYLDKKKSPLSRRLSYLMKLDSKNAAKLPKNSQYCQNFGCPYGHPNFVELN
jgi:hypothetical protein